MGIENELKKSFYKEVAVLDEAHGISVVQNVDTGKIYVQKVLDHYDRGIYEYIRTAKLKGVPAVADIFEDDGRLTVIEDYINGSSLEEILSKGLPGPDEAFRLITALCDILEPLHSHTPPIIHRDIKPANIIIGSKEEVFLVDFDASRVVSEGRSRDTELFGTVEYAAPEQYGFGQSDQRTDIYALGVLLNKLLTGAFPAEKLCSGPAAAVVKKSTEMDPAARFRSAAELKAAVRECSGEHVTIDVEIDDSRTGKGAHPDEGKAAPSGSGYAGETEEPASSGREDSGYDDEYVDTGRGLPHSASGWCRFLIGNLPGLRSGSIPVKIGGAVWYIFIIVYGFFGVARTEGWTPQKDRFYDAILFFLFFSLTLYLGNYLGVREYLPWERKLGGDFLKSRAVIGCVIIFMFWCIIAAILSTLLGIG